MKNVLDCNDRNNRINIAGDVFIGLPSDFIFDNKTMTARPKRKYGKFVRTIFRVKKTL